MSRFSKKLGVALLSLAGMTASFAGGVSFFFGVSQPMYAPVVMRSAYIPQERCYTEAPVYMNGMLYPGQRVCEHRMVPAQAAWVSEGGPEYYRIHRHHISYKSYY